MENDKSKATFIGRLFSPVKSIFNKLQKFLKKDNDAEIFIKNQEQCIKAIKDFELLDTLSNDSWKQLQDKELSKLHKIVMTEMLLNVCDDDLSLTNMLEYFENGSSFTRSSMIDNIDKAMASFIKMSSDQTDVIDGKISDVYIARAKDDKVNRMVSLFKEKAKQFLKNKSKDIVSKNSEEMELIQNNYANKHMALYAFYELKLPKNTNLKSEFIREFAKQNIGCKLQTVDQIEIFVKTVANEIKDGISVEQALKMGLASLENLSKTKEAKNMRARFNVILEDELVPGFAVHKNNVGNTRQR